MRTEHLDDAVLEVLAQWLPLQRWYAGKGRYANFSLQRLATLSTSPVEVAIYTVTAHYELPDSLVSPTDEPSIEPHKAGPQKESYEIFQVPLVFYPEPAEHLEHALVGTLVTGNDAKSSIWVYDALQDKEVTRLWLSGFETGQPGSLSFQRFTDDELPLSEPSLALTAEQSNTSLVFGDNAILKVFRRLEPGISTDIEVHRALTALGARHVAPLFGSITADIEAEPTSLAMLQSFLRTGTDGWDLAKISVRDLMAEGDLHAAEAGGDFAGEAQRLGNAVAEVHDDLATAFGVGTIAGAKIKDLAMAMHARLDAALTIVEQLHEVEAGLRATFDAFAAVGDSDVEVSIQRIHADLHLGQTLRTANGWIILDFEGEPSASLAQRRAFDSPLRDLAGMLRSFDYAAHHQLIDTTHSTQLAYRAIEWSQRNRAAFCDGYAETVGRDPREQLMLLRGYEADKAVYEAVYEARNRPSWLLVPLSSLARLVSA